MQKGFADEGHGQLERRRLDRRDRGNLAVRFPRRGRGDCHARQRGSRRPSAWTVRAVLRRNVGALLLLRHACAADPLSHQVLAVRRWQGQPDLRRLYQPRLYYPGARRLSGGSLVGATQGGAVRGGIARLRPPVHGLRRRAGDRRSADQTGRPGAQCVLAGAGADQRRHRFSQGQYLGDRRPPLPHDRCAPRRGLHHLLYGGQRRCLLRHGAGRLSRRDHRLVVGLRACRASAWCWG